MSPEQLIEQDLSFKAENLARAMRSLGARLLRLADELERNPQDALLNSLGEIQAEGSIINAGAGAYMATKAALDTVRSVARIGAEDPAVVAQPEETGE